MGRARGANAQIAFAFSTAGYGSVPTTGFRPVPMVSVDLGEDQGLQEDDLLGLGREEREADEGVINNEGGSVVPVDLRNFGYWLKLLLGEPVTSAGVAATGSVLITGQPANNSVLTVNGTDVTFVTGTAGAGQVKVGATIAETLANLVAFLNASADASIDDATYSADVDGATLIIEHDTLGTAGNAFTLAKGTSPVPDVTLSGATLTGGAASGAYNHVFTAGQLSHPDAAVQITNPEVPQSRMNWGVMADSMSIQGQRSGLLNASLQLVAQGETKDAASMAGTLGDAFEVERFSQFTGQIEADHVPLARVETFTLRIANNLDKDESIRRDGRIGGADPGKLTVGLNLTLRFADTVMQARAEAGTPLRMTVGWRISATKRLDFIMDNVRLPRSKVPLSGPGGIRVSYSARALKRLASQNALRAVLVNDVASY